MGIMHYVVAFSTILAVSYCAPLPKDSEATILNYDYKNDGNGNYKYSFETSNGIKREETGILVNVGLPNEHTFVSGSYSYINPDGIVTTVQYIADERGYAIILPQSMKVFSVVSPNVLATLLGK